MKKKSKLVKETIAIAVDRSTLCDM